MIKIKKRTNNILKKLFFLNKKTKPNNQFSHGGVDSFKEIAKLVKEARIKQNLTVDELSFISKIPKRTINSIENNNKNTRPMYPFIRSILFKLEECLGFKKNTLVKLALKERQSFNREKNNFLINKVDLINTWQGILVYFFVLILSIFALKRYFVLNVNVIEIQDIKSKIIDK